jgi:Ca-activated chloride channel family protein
MHINAHLGVDLIAVDQADQVSCLLELRAPQDPSIIQRPGRTLVIALDRSGSMGGEPLMAARKSIAALVCRLAPQDSFGLVVFDDQAEVVLPCAPLADRDAQAMASVIAGIHEGGSTDIGSGYLLALREAKSALRRNGHSSATVLLVSDGHANKGITEPDRIHGVASTATQERVVTNSLGFGLGYDEILLEAMSRGGNGTHRFAPDVDVCMGELQQAVTDLLDVCALATTVRITTRDSLIDSIVLRQDLPVRHEPGELVIELGDMYAGEERRLLLELGVPGIPDLGTRVIADVEIEFTAVRDLTEHRMVLPVAVNVVPGDEAVGRVPNPVVEVEELLADVDDAKRQAASQLRSHDVDAARTSLGKAVSDVAQKRRDMRGAPAGITARLDEAAEELLGLAHDITHESVEYTTKSMTAAFGSNSRKKSSGTTQEEARDDSK